MNAHALTIGHLARETGTKVETIRFYEKSGLLPAPARTEGRHDVAGQQLFLAEQTSVLERLEVGQIAQRVEPELEQEFFRGDIGVGRARRRAARAGRDQAGAAQIADQVAADLLAEESWTTRRG
jgi:hypothetical protein